MAPVMVFVTLCLTMSVFESKGDEHRLNYGIIFQKEKNLEFASENWIHTWRIDIPTEDQIFSKPITLEDTLTCPI